MRLAYNALVPAVYAVPPNATTPHPGGSYFNSMTDAEMTELCTRLRPFAWSLMDMEFQAYGPGYVSEEILVAIDPLFYVVWSVFVDGLCNVSGVNRRSIEIDLWLNNLIPAPEQALRAGLTGAKIEEMRLAYNALVPAAYAVPPQGTPPHTHTPGATATCTTPQVCTGCGEQLAPAAGHTPGEWIVDVDATATTDGSKHKVCTVCEITVATESIPATGGGGSTQPDKGIFGTNAKWYGAWWHYLLFFIGFGFIWMWF